MIAMLSQPRTVKTWNHIVGTVCNPFAVQQYHFTYKTLATQKVSMLNALFKPVKIGTALNVRGLHWKTEPVSLYHVLNCLRLRYGTFSAYYSTGTSFFTQFCRITGINVPRF
jgi:hypothetical protein